MEYCVIDNVDIVTLVYEYLCSDGYIAVVEKNRRLVGVFGYKEYLNYVKCVTSCDHDIENVPLKSWLNSSPIVATINDGITGALDIMKERNISYVPVIDKDDHFIKFESNQKNNCIDHKEITKRFVAQRWRLFDKYVNDREYELRCPICQTIIPENAKKKVSYDIWGGGRLIRYVCNVCGAVIGPKKMYMLEESDFNLDYEQHYKVYSEGDTTEDEIYTFGLLEGKKNGIYLNYGCGGEWSKSIEQLRKNGYVIYGYEPFAGVSKKDYVISDKDALRGMKFDGIITNNLIEHLKNPIEELKFMKGLLKNNQSIMVHSTGCFEYQYPYTRFHVCFPLGESAGLMFKKAGLNIENRIECVLHGDKTISYVVSGSM